MHPFHRVRVDDQGDLSGRLERYLKCWTQEGFEDVMREPDAFDTVQLTWIPGLDGRYNQEGGTMIMSCMRMIR